VRVVISIDGSTLDELDHIFRAWRDLARERSGHPEGERKKKKRKELRKRFLPLDRKKKPHLNIALSKSGTTSISFPFSSTSFDISKQARIDTMSNHIDDSTRLAPGHRLFPKKKNQFSIKGRRKGAGSIKTFDQIQTQTVSDPDSSPCLYLHFLSHFCSGTARDQTCRGWDKVFRGGA
jgi:hypothetical protein